MYQQKLCISLADSYGMPQVEQIALAKAAGFEGVFPIWDPSENTVKDLRTEADRVGIAIPAIHAPFIGCDAIWFGDDAAAKPLLDQLYACLDDCRTYHIPVMVCHVMIGFDEKPAPNKAGLARFAALSDRAAEYGVVVAYENTEHEEFLAALLDHLQGHKGAGFCWDSGHELCYQRGRDILTPYRDRLTVTHLNDNLGVRDHGGEITWLDDLHLLPFDGIADWEYNAKRLADAKEVEYLTFELVKTSKPDRHENDCYEALPLPLYFAEAYKRACRVAALVKRQKGN